MKTWLQILPLLKEHAEVIIEPEHGGRTRDRIMGGGFSEHYVSCGTGTYSLRNGWHVLGGRRIVDVVCPERTQAKRTEREKLIGRLVRRNPQTHGGT